MPEGGARALGDEPGRIGRRRLLRIAAYSAPVAMLADVTFAARALASSPPGDGWPCDRGQDEERHGREDEHGNRGKDEARHGREDACRDQDGHGDRE